jgi:capsular exopolysaccharide synthesis family protein
MNRKSIDGNVLKRDADSNRLLYEGLLQRAKETGVSGELKTSTIRLVDPAVAPLLPINSSPKKPMGFLAAFLAGVLLACGVAFLFEFLDDRIKTPDDISAHLGLPTLGLVPLVASKLLENQQTLISNRVPFNFAEAVRSIRTGVLFSIADSVDSRAQTILVTSAGPGEGKTTSAGNLAAGIAKAGLRVLLIDADLRRPAVHDLFGIKQEPGLSNLLVGDAPAEKVVLQSDVEGLWLLPAGHIPPNPSELLLSQRFKNFLFSLGEHFDWVVVDAPPALVVTDAAAIAHLAHGIAFVVGADMTSRRAAAEAVDQLKRANGRMIGAVLNRVNVERHPYYYSQYYRREYSNYAVRSSV